MVLRSTPALFAPSETLAPLASASMTSICLELSAGSVRWFRGLPPPPVQKQSEVVRIEWDGPQLEPSGLHLENHLLVGWRNLGSDLANGKGRHFSAIWLGIQCRTIGRFGPLRNFTKRVDLLLS
jgi:hypothetical protein